MKKKLTLLATAVALGALVVVGATMAYFTSQDTATNVVTVGNVNISIVETSKDENAIMNENGIQYQGAITPGQAISKIPTVRNDGSNPAYVRAYVELKYYDKDKNDITETFTGKTPEIVFNTAVNETEGYWIAGTEGEKQYYYYSKAIPADETGITTQLFDTVTIPKEWNNDQANVTVEVIVHADGIQSENNGTDVIKAFANFE